MKEEIKNKVIPEICSRQSQPYVKAKRLISPTETLGDDGIGIRAFTLIELLVVVLIIGILSAIALPQYQKAVMKSRYTNLKNLTNSIADAQELYYIANNSYSDSFDKLDIQLGGELNSPGNYTWGSCRFFSDNSGMSAAIRCSNSSIGMGYERRFIYTTSQPNRTKCYAYTADMKSPQVKICFQETNDSDPDSPSGERRFTYK